MSNEIRHSRKRDRAGRRRGIGGSRAFVAAWLAMALLGVLLVLPGGAGAVAAATDGTRRIALVIGNSAYRHTPALPNPAHDAEDMAAALKRLDFEVIEGQDLELRQLQVKLEEFARRANKSEAALIFYAGHGLQYRGENYLVPVDAEIKDEISIYYQTLHINEMLKALEQAPGARLLILDTCRDLPLPEGARTQEFLSTGFAKFDARRNMVIAYSTGAKEVAYDGSGRNSFFTGALLQQIETPGLEISQMLLRVAREVSAKTDNKQVPETSRTLASDFFFNPGETETQFWARVQDSTDPAEIIAFLARFPNGANASDARKRLTALAAAGAPRLGAPSDGRPAAPTAAAGALNPDLPAQLRLIEAERRLQAEYAERERKRQEQIAKEFAERQKVVEEEERLQSEFAAREQERQRQAAREFAERQRLDAEEERLRAAFAERERLRREQIAREIAEQRQLTEEELRLKATFEARERQRLEAARQATEQARMAAPDQATRPGSDLSDAPFPQDAVADASADGNRIRSTDSHAASDERPPGLTEAQWIEAQERLLRLEHEARSEK